MLCFHCTTRIEDQLTHSVCLMAIRLRRSWSLAKEIFSLCKLNASSLMYWNAFILQSQICLGEKVIVNSHVDETTSYRSNLDQMRLLAKTFRYEAIVSDRYRPINICMPGHVSACLNNNLPLLMAYLYTHSFQESFYKQRHSSKNRMNGEKWPQTSRRSRLVDASCFQEIN